MSWSADEKERLPQQAAIPMQTLDDGSNTDAGGNAGDHDASSVRHLPNNRFGRFTLLGSGASRRTKLLIGAVLLVLVLLVIIIVPAAVVTSEKNASGNAAVYQCHPRFADDSTTSKRASQQQSHDQQQAEERLKRQVTRRTVDNTSAWIQLPNLPWPRSDESADTVNGKIYITGGCTSEQICDVAADACSCSAYTDAVRIFDPVTYEMDIGQSMPTPRYRHTTCVWQDSIFVFNGRTLPDDVIITQIDVYNTTNNTWTTTASVYPSDLGSDNSCFVIGDIIYVMGGYSPDYSVSTNVTYQYYPATDTWVLDSAQMVYGRGDFSAVAINGLGYAYGGFQSPNFCVPLDKLEVFNPSSSSWSVLAESYDFSAEKRTGVILDGRIFMIGGQTSSDPVTCGDLQITLISEVLSYDPASNTWRNETWMPVPLFRFAATTFENKIYLIGGQGSLISDSYPPYFPIEDTIYEFTYTNASTPVPSPSASATATSTPVPSYGNSCGSSLSDYSK